VPFHPAEDLGSPAWFDQIPVPLPSEVPDRPHLVVEHHAIASQNRTVIHQQIFNQNKLVGWIPGQAKANSDLILNRSIDCDTGDLLGHLPATEIIAKTSVVIGNNVQTCAVGITNVSRPGLEEVAAGTVDIRFDVLHTPFGDAEIAIRLNPDGSQRLVKPPEANSDITMRLRWPALTEWLHTDTDLGHLVGNGEIEFDGPVLKLSYIEGHISWPRSPQDRQQSERFKKTMDTYTRLRLSPDYLELMDEIDEATSP